MGQMTKEPAIRFQAQVFKMQTVIDGGIRLTLDLGAVDPSVIVALIGAKHPGVLLEVAAVAVEFDKQTGANGQPELEKGRQRKSGWENT